MFSNFFRTTEKTLNVPRLSREVQAVYPCGPADVEDTSKSTLCIEKRLHRQNVSVAKFYLSDLHIFYLSKMGSLTRRKHCQHHTELRLHIPSDWKWHLRYLPHPEGPTLEIEPSGLNPQVHTRKTRGRYLLKPQAGLRNRSFLQNKIPRR